MFYKLNYYWHTKCWPCGSTAQQKNRQYEIRDPFTLSLCQNFPPLLIKHLPSAFYFRAMFALSVLPSASSCKIIVMHLIPPFSWIEQKANTQTHKRKCPKFKPGQKLKQRLKSRNLVKAILIYKYSQVLAGYPHSCRYNILLGIRSYVIGTAVIGDILWYFHCYVLPICTHNIVHYLEFKFDIIPVYENQHTQNSQCHYEDGNRNYYSCKTNEHWWSN